MNYRYLKKDQENAKSNNSILMTGTIYTAWSAQNLYSNTNCQKMALVQDRFFQIMIEITPQIHIRKFQAQTT